MTEVAWALFGLMAAALTAILSTRWSLRSAIAAQGVELGRRIDSLGTDLGGRIDGLTAEVHSGFAAVRGDIAAV